MKNLGLMLFIIFSLTACKKDNLSNSTSKLIGKWSWIESCPGTGHTGCWSPGSIYQAYDIVLDQDSTYYIFHLDTLKSSFKFHTYKSLTDYHNDTTYFIKLETGSTIMYSISHDTLQLTNNEGVVTITSRYKRFK
jgi:hypothetical protein